MTDTTALKKSLFKWWALTSLTLFQSTSFAQQDPQLTQFWNVSSSFNPANTGLFYKHQAGINYRNQWDGVNGAPNSLLAVYNAKLDKYKSGIGFNGLYETIGSMTQSRVDLNYSYHLDFGNERLLSFGAAASISQIAYKEGYFGNTASGKGTAFGANFGITYKTKRLTLGLSSTNLNEARISEAYFAYARHYYLSASYDFDLSSDFSLKPQVLLVTDGIFFSTDINLLATYKKQYWLGITNRNFDSFCFTAGIDFKEKYRIGYSYDLPISKLASISKGSHEIALGFLLK